MSTWICFVLRNASPPCITTSYTVKQEAGADLGCAVVGFQDPDPRSPLDDVISPSGVTLSTVTR
jgi:hypothetical protein